VVKLEALAAKHIAAELRIDSIWSWGWATFSTAGQDPDKTAAACVWVWARDPTLCDAPTMVRHTFDESRTEGQLILPPGARCLFADGSRMTRADVARLAALTGDRDLAASALLERVVLRDEGIVDPVTILAAERGIVLSRFGGSRTGYSAGLRRARLNVLDARALIADRLDRNAVEARFRPPAPTAAELDDFLATYADQPARLVETDAPAPWLGDSDHGWAIASLAPERLFTLPARRQATIFTSDGRFVVRPAGLALPLGLLPDFDARGAASAALLHLRKEDVYRSWLRNEERRRLGTALCVRDALPTPGAVDLSPFVPFLAE
jgi:hypothetical protein